MSERVANAVVQTESAARSVTRNCSRSPVGHALVGRALVGRSLRELRAW